MANTNKASRKTRFTDCAAGIKSNITANVSIDGVDYTPASLGAVFTDAVTAMDTADAKHKEWLDDVAAGKAAVSKASKVYNAFRKTLIGQYGAGDNSVLGKYGMVAPKQSTPKAATKAAAAVKAQATRELRHTMGKNQKKLVKSNVAVQIAAVPATAAPALAPSAAGATSTQPASGANGAAAATSATPAKPAG